MMHWSYRTGLKETGRSLTQQREAEIVPEKRILKNAASANCIVTKTLAGDDIKKNEK